MEDNMSKKKQHRSHYEMPVEEAEEAIEPVVEMPAFVECPQLSFGEDTVFEAEVVAEVEVKGPAVVEVVADVVVKGPAVVHKPTRDQLAHATSKRRRVTDHAPKATQSKNQ